MHSRRWPRHARPRRASVPAAGSTAPGRPAPRLPTPPATARRAAISRARRPWFASGPQRSLLGLRGLLQLLLDRLVNLSLHLVHREARHALAGWIVDEGLQEHRRPARAFERDVRVVGPPLVLAVALYLCVLVRVHAQVEHARQTQAGERIGPDVHLARLALFAEHQLPGSLDRCAGLQDIEA